MEEFRHGDHPVILQAEVPEGSSHSQARGIVERQPHPRDFRLVLQREHSPLALLDPLGFSRKIGLEIDRQLDGDHRAAAGAVLGRKYGAGVPDIGHEEIGARPEQGDGGAAAAEAVERGVRSELLVHRLVRPSERLLQNGERHRQPVHLTLAGRPTCPPPPLLAQTAEAAGAGRAGGTVGEEGEELEGERVPDLARDEVAVRAVAVEDAAEDAAISSEIFPEDHTVLVDALASLLGEDGGDAAAAAAAVVGENPAGNGEQVVLSRRPPLRGATLAPPDEPLLRVAAAAAWYCVAISHG